MQPRFDTAQPIDVRTPRRSKTGRRLGRYRVGALIARGSTARVYRGEDERGNAVAIKFLHDHLLDNRTVLARFYDEAETMTNQNAGLASILEHGLDEQGSAFIVMEMVEGINLAEFLQRRGPLGSDELVDLGVQLARTLAQLHESGTVHRDLKPANVGMAPDSTRALGYRAVVLDLGLAKHITSANRRAQTATGCILGTPRYMAPEQYSDSRSADPRSDVYALGCILYHAATGQAPFVGTPSDEARAHRDLHPPAASSVRPELPGALSELLDYMLAKSPELRPQSMLEVCRLLRGASELRWIPRLAAGSFTDAPRAQAWDDADTFVD